MIDAITAAQQAMNQRQLALEALSENVSNMHTPGYKRQVAINSAFETALAADKSTIEQAMTIAHDHRQGTIEQSQRPLDLAIHGAGFFVVQLEDGLAYTRRGDFHLNKNGELVSFDGHPVMSQGGIIRLDSDKVVIKNDGSIYQDDRPIGKLSLVEPEHPEQLTALGSGYYQAQDSGNMDMSSHSQIKQGFLEQSNIKSVDEMTDMLRISREFQSAQKLMRQADEMMNQAINNLGEG